MLNHRPDRRDLDRRALQRAWAAERAASTAARSSDDPRLEWYHLERAHVLSQPMAMVHVRTHWAMLRFGVRARDGREVAGQLLRLVVAGPGSLSGHYPEGNTGGAAISALAVLPLPDDLAPLLRVGS